MLNKFKDLQTCKFHINDRNKERICLLIAHQFINLYNRLILCSFEVLFFPFIISIFMHFSQSIKKYQKYKIINKTSPKFRKNQVATQTDKKTLYSTHDEEKIYFFHANQVMTKPSNQKKKHRADVSQPCVKILTYEMRSSFFLRRIHANSKSSPPKSGIRYICIFDVSEVFGTMRPCESKVYRSKSRFGMVLVLP